MSIAGGVYNTQHDVRNGESFTSESEMVKHGTA